MSQSKYFRGARLGPKQEAPLQGRLNEEVSYPQFVVYMAHTAIAEYGQRDMVTFLKHVGTAFEAMLKQLPEGKKSEGAT